MLKEAKTYWQSFLWQKLETSPLAFQKCQLHVTTRTRFFFLLRMLKIRYLTSNEIWKNFFTRASVTMLSQIRLINQKKCFMPECNNFRFVGRLAMGCTNFVCEQILKSNLILAETNSFLKQILRCCVSLVNHFKRGLRT